VLNAKDLNLLGLGVQGGESSGNGKRAESERRMTEHPPAGHQTIRTSRDRLWQSLMALAEIGATPDCGSHRLALTDEDAAGQRLFSSWATDAGCALGRDSVGNLFATRAGADPGRPAVVIGSHLDTQPNAGRFDGPVGVLAGLEVIRTLNDSRITTHAPLVVASWTNEEGARFPTSLTGSSVFVGLLAEEQAKALQAVDGPTFGAELERLALVDDSGPSPAAIGFYLELHIEQNTILERNQIDIGIVERGQGIRALAVALKGVASHAGTTPMNDRRDALLAAARVVEQANHVGHDMDALVTVGRIVVQPNSRAVIPGEAELVIDIRSPDSSRVDEVEDAMKSTVAEIAERSGVGAHTRRALDIPAVTFDSAIRERVRRSCDQLGLSSMPLISGAAHDAMSLAHLVPTALVFIPCRGGVSHQPEEYAEPDQIGAGCDVMLQTALALAEVA
jgi:beta-ureidopropionase / N-carbamoyl-L-amino-acid hydrolase